MEYSRLKAAQIHDQEGTYPAVSSPSAGGGNPNHVAPPTNGEVDTNCDAEMMAEAKLLRQHKGRLEARMQILEDHNRQLEAQLQRLRQLLDQVRSKYISS